MYKKVTKSQKEEILKSFINGISIKDISKTYQFTIPTITRQLKTLLGESQFLKIKTSSFNNHKNIKNDFNNNELNKINMISKHKEETIKNDLSKDKNSEKESSYELSFIEIPPLDCEVRSEYQKDISSIPLEKINFPGETFMIVSNKIELQTKFLKEYHQWQFLPFEDLERNTIEIFHDIKSAKRACNKDQKVIKVPNNKVFKIVAPILMSRGISRIISNDRLISL